MGYFGKGSVSTAGFCPVRVIFLVFGVSGPAPYGLDGKGVGWESGVIISGAFFSFYIPLAKTLHGIQGTTDTARLTLLI